MSNPKNPYLEPLFQGISTARFRIGEHLLREPDYRQILDWADHLGMKPKAVLQHIAQSREECVVFEPSEKLESISLEIVDGSIRTLVWDIDQLGVIPSKWREGVSIKTLAFIGSWPPTIPQQLSPVPGLTRLVCSGNQLTELDLSPVPGLTRLDCGGNQFTALDLSPVPGLTDLECSGNRLTELDLSPVPGLTELNCSANSLTKLDLSSVQSLTKLNCCAT